jgi:hypothetical protein
MRKAANIVTMSMMLAAMGIALLLFYTVFILGAVLTVVVSRLIFTAARGAVSDDGDDD